MTANDARFAYGAYTRAKAYLDVKQASSHLLPAAGESAKERDSRREVRADDERFLVGIRAAVRCRG